MRYRDSIFGTLLKEVDRAAFAASVARHDGDRYGKSFTSWQHFVSLLYAQLSGSASLRALAAGWNAHAHHHYHLGAGPVSRSTLADANQRRPAAIFAETFAHISARADRRFRRETGALMRLIDSSPIELGGACDWAAWNGRTNGMKLHVVYDPDHDHPGHVDITPSTINDVVIGRAVPIEPGATYVFDKGYCDYDWWTRLHDAGCVFVTRPKTNVKFRTEAVRTEPMDIGDGFVVLEDARARLAGQGKANLPMALRRITLRTADARVLTLVSNDLDAPAQVIAQIYKRRWQIELLFRWIKQNLKIRTFLGRSETAVRLQILAAMIAFLLLRLASKSARSPLQSIRFAELVRHCLFVRKRLDAIDKPPETPATRHEPDPKQMSFAYA